jgi:DNA-binding CsgD family transcriptional regulator
VLYGRDTERAAIGELLEAARASRSSALVVRGEAGIGKTALLEDARERAPDMHVLSARGVESESELPFAAVHQLLRPALTHIEKLPAPQASALGGALGLDAGGADERFLVFAGCLSLLSEMAERRPVLCLVDDAHWLDGASEDALLFVARRLEAEGIVLLFGAREGEVRAFEAPGVPSLVLGALDAEAAGTLLARGAGVEAAPSVRDRLVEQTGGNALALLEVPSALTKAQLAGAEPLPEALPLTRQIERAFLERVRRLPEDTQRLLLIAAADDASDVGLVTRAAEHLEADLRALDVAEQASLVSVHGIRLEFRHPLVRSAIYEAATSRERHEVHRALAEVLARQGDRPDRCAWHRAAATVGTDEAVAEELEQSAGRAGQRAGHGAAAAALVRAADLSEDGTERSRRLLLAARASHLAGRYVQTVAITERAAALAPDPIAKADLALLRGDAELWHGRPAQTSDLLAAAAEAVTAHDTARALELACAAAEAGAIAGDADRMGRAARVAEAITPADDRQVLLSLLTRGGEPLMRGDLAAAAPLFRRGFGLSAGDEPRDIIWAAIVAVLAGEYAQAKALYDAAAARARQLGALGPLVHVLSGQALCNLFFAYPSEASEAAHEAVRLAADLGIEDYAAHAVGVLAWVSALRGRADDHRAFAEQVELAGARGLAFPPAAVTWGRAELALAEGRLDDALGAFSAVAEFGPGFGHPLIALASAPGLVEAAARAGRPELGASALARLEAWVDCTSPQHARPLLERSQALFAETEAEARHLFEQALGMHEEGGSPFHRARTELLFGEHLRRQRKRVESREHLRSALEAFEALGASPWADRARAELRASGETARKRDPSTLSQLTPQELQIARFVAEGLSNKEVAAQLFLSPRTIDSHLRNVFAKLAITSRTQLARLRLGDEEAVSSIRAAAPA